MTSDLIYKLKVPSQDIWYVQNILENFDGMALVTNALMDNDFGTFLIYTNKDHDVLLKNIIKSLHEEIETLELSREE